LYFVNWQRDIRISTINGRKVVIKKDKPIKSLNEQVLVFIFTFMSLVLLHPTRPLRTGTNLLKNEGFLSRKKLSQIGILTPQLIQIDNDVIIEEFIEEGNLYTFLDRNNDMSFAFRVGKITRKLHDAGFCFIDNKAQNYLIRDSQIYRTDLGLIQNQATEYMKSLDIGIFLASLLDLGDGKYQQIENFFLKGYRNKDSSKFVMPYLSIIIRNIASLVLSSNHNNLAKNLLAKSEI
jgi:tRNA A-37 threonylcarbamoyl transferase component Bud32